MRRINFKRMQETRDCDTCGSIVKHIPAGTSKKTGKPYNDFWVCSNDNCDTNTKRQQSTTQAPNRPTEVSSGVTDPILERLATRLDSIDEKLDYLIMRSKTEGSWKPTTSSQESEPPSPTEE